MDDFKELLARGLKGEALIREFLKLQGLYVLPVSLIANEGAPAFVGKVKKIIASDMIVAGNGVAYLAEGKSFERPTYSGHYKREEHGIPIRLWEQYILAEKETGMIGYLVILEISTKTILQGKLSDIVIGSHIEREHYPPSGKHPTNPGEIFFDRRRFKWYDLETLIEIDIVSALIPKSVPPKTIRPWEKGRKITTDRQLPLI